MKNLIRSLEHDNDSGGYSFSKNIKKKEKKQKKQELLKKQIEKRRLI